MGHVNNANHLTYAEEARIDYLNKIFGLKMSWKKQGVILAAVEINYHSPLLYPGNYQIQTRTEKIGTKSFTLTFRIKENRSRKLIALGKTVLVAYDYEKGRSIPVPASWSGKIRKFENSGARK